MTADMDLFLDGKASEPDDTFPFSLSLQSKAVVFFIFYPQPQADVNSITIVLPDECHIGSSSSSLQNIPVIVKSRQELNNNLASAVQLPALISVEQEIVLCGLPSIIRTLSLRRLEYAEKGEDKIREKLLCNLLGLHQNCLKACKEKSKWTLFCEVTLPDKLSSFISSKMVCTATENVPEFMQDLEYSFYVSVPNQRKNVFSEIDKANLESRKPILNSKCHAFLEGKKMTIVDAISAFYILTCCSESEDFQSWLNNILTHDEYPNLSKFIDRFRRDDEFQEAFLTLAVIKCHFELPCYDYAYPTLLDSMRKQHFRVRNTTELKSMIDDSSSSSLDFQWSENNTLGCSGLPDWLAEGVPEYRYLRKRDQLANMAAAVAPLARPGDVIVDFCSGSGHLGLFLAYLLPQCRILLLENKAESIQYALEKIRLLKFSNVSVIQCNITSFNGHFDIGVALHACGSVTDIVLDMCLQIQATCIVSPCCHGSVRASPCIQYPRSQRFIRHFSELDYHKLCHAADRIDGRNSRVVLGKDALMLVDSDRCWFMQEQGYGTVELLQMSPPDCSPKNTIIVART